MAKNGISNSWTFTVNNWTDDDINKLKRLTLNYLAVGKEVGESGTPHLQGFVIWKRAYRLAGLKKLCPGWHWEIAKAIDAENYSFKEDNDPLIVDNRKKKTVEAT